MVCNRVIFLHALSLPESALRAEYLQRNQRQIEWWQTLDARKVLKRRGIYVYLQWLRFAKVRKQHKSKRKMLPSLAKVQLLYIY